MEFKYLVHYCDNRLSSPYQSKTIKTANIKAWIERFEDNNSSYVKVIGHELER